jgi:hypothetical protein
MKRLALIALLTLLGAVSARAQGVYPNTAVTTNGSVVIATGSTFQTVLAAVTVNPVNPIRHSLTIQNNNTTSTDNCWITFGTGITAGTATKAKSIILAPGQAYTRYWPYIPSDEIEGTCTTTGNSLYVDTQ